MLQILMGPLQRWAGRLRFPWLLALTATVFAINIVVPDPLPFVDEILLALGTLLFASLKKRRADKASSRETNPPTLPR